MSLDAGKVPPAEVPKLYDEADIYITTPDIDCMPGSILEALASGVPVVATRTGGIPYLVTDQVHALLVDLDDDRAVAEAILTLLGDPALVERLTAAGRDELARYTPYAVREAWWTLYQELVKH